MTDSSASGDGESAEDETPRGAQKPETLDSRESVETAESEAPEEDEIPPEARDDEDERYEDRYGEARKVENPDQHRDEEAYD